LGVRDGSVSRFVVRGAPPPRHGALEPRRSRASIVPAARGWFTTLLDLPAGVGLGPGEGQIVVELRMPPGFELSETAPLRIRSEVSRRSDLLLLEAPQFEVEASHGAVQRIVLEVHVASLSAPVTEAEVIARLDYIMCRSSDHAA